jgi:fatty acid desaturase
MKNDRGLFKYSIDVWPVTIVLVTTATALLPFFVHLSLWVTCAIWAVVIYARTFVPFIQHNHAHLPVFRSKVLNGLFDVLLAQNTGYATALWELHHNRGHHRNFLDPKNDPAALTYPGSNVVMSRWMYALRGNVTIHRDSIRVGLAEGRAGRKTLLAKLTLELVVQTALTIVGLVYAPLLTLAFFVVPNAFSAFLVWWQSYPHHHELDTSSIYSASVTVEGHWHNLVTFNIGHHTAHHEKPTLHWSLLPKRTEAIRHLIHAACFRGAKVETPTSIRLPPVAGTTLR